jgi:membrane protease YdiL (CAAX protease family)
VGVAAVFLGSLAILVMAVALAYRLPRHNRRAIFGLKHSTRGAVLMGANVGVGMVIAAGVILAVGTALDHSLKNRLKDSSPELGSGALAVTATVVALVVLAPLGEELLFRGLLLRALTRRLRFGWAAVVSGVLFGCSHLDTWFNFMWPRLIALVLVGVGLAWLYRWRGYAASVTAHATVNVAAAIALIAQS